MKMKKIMFLIQEVLEVENQKKVLLLNFLNLVKKLKTKKIKEM